MLFRSEATHIVSSVFVFILIIQKYSFSFSIFTDRPQLPEVYSFYYYYSFTMLFESQTIMIDDPELTTKNLKVEQTEETVRVL